MPREAKMVKSAHVRKLFGLSFLPRRPPLCYSSKRMKVNVIKKKKSDGHEKLKTFDTKSYNTNILIFFYFFDKFQHF